MCLACASVAPEPGVAERRRSLTRLARLEGEESPPPGAAAALAAGWAPDPSVFRCEDGGAAALSGGRFAARNGDVRTRNK